MDDLRTQLGSVLRRTERVAALVQAHYAVMEKVGFSGAEPQLAARYTEHLQGAEHATTLLEKLSEGKITKLGPVRSVITVMGAARELVQHLRDVVDGLIQHAPRTDITQYGSQTSSGIEISSATLTQLVEHQRRSQEYVSKLEGELTEELDQLAVSTIPAEWRSHPDLEALRDQAGGLRPAEVPIFSALCQDLLVRSPPEAVKAVLLLVEQLRTQSLGEADLSLRWPAPGKAGKADRVPLAQRLIQTYRLLPSEPLQPIDDLLHSLMPDLNPKLAGLVGKPDALLARLEKLSAAAGVGFLVWSWGGPNPKLHTYRLLTSAEYLHANVGEISPTEGVSDRYLAATRTITDLEPSGVEYQLQTSGPVQHWVVLETPDGSGWRYLRPWSSSAHLIPHHWLDALGDRRCAPSPRVQAYNSILEEQILSCIEKPYIPYTQLTRDEAVRDQLYWRNLRQRIRKASWEDWQAAAGKAATAAKVAENLRKSDYYQRLVAHIAESIAAEEHANWDSVAAELLTQELQMTYFQQMERIRDGLRQAIEGAVHTVGKAKPRLGVEGLWEAAVEEGLSRYINHRNNIYLSLDNKTALLKKTLIRE
jgi:hypothetical protein